MWQHELDFDELSSDFPRSRWFTRGWTLQELLAPKAITFYNTSWHELGNLIRGDYYYSPSGRSAWRSNHQQMKRLVSEITGIPRPYVGGYRPLNIASIAMKMSWASTRQTTRLEDIAYCLLGLFDVAMPMLYGEGMKAFTRLQEEIMKNEDDESLFAWWYDRNRDLVEIQPPVLQNHQPDLKAAAKFDLADGPVLSPTTL